VPGDAITAQVLAFIGALALAYFTGAWRKAGRRMERLFELAEKLPKESDVRKRFEAEGLREAERIAARSLGRPPARVRIASQILTGFIGLQLLAYWLTFLHGRGMLERASSNIGRTLGELVGEQTQAFPDVPWQVFLVAGLVSIVWFYAALFSLFFLGKWWWQNGDVRLFWFRLRSVGRNHRLLHLRSFGSEWLRRGGRKAWDATGEPPAPRE
jgi:hypothetical protein